VVAALLLFCLLPYLWVAIRSIMENVRASRRELVKNMAKIERPHGFEFF
jgi:hypothetical protein